MERKRPWFLKYDSDGRPRPNWKAILSVGFFAFIAQATASTIVSLYARPDFPRRLASTLVLSFMPLVVVGWSVGYIALQREVDRFRGEPPRIRFGIRAILLVTAIACVWLSAARLEMQTTHKHHLDRNTLIEQLTSTLGSDVEARWSGNTNKLSVKVSRSNFNDDDFRQLVEQLDTSNMDAHVYFLSLENTSITDASLERISDWQRLEYLILDGTAITDTGVKSLRSLESLRMVTLSDTKVSEEVRTPFSRL